MDGESFSTSSSLYKVSLHHTHAAFILLFVCLITGGCWDYMLPVHFMQMADNYVCQNKLHITFLQTKAIGIFISLLFDSLFIRLRRWDETIFFPIKYKDLPSTAQIAFTIWDIYSPRQCFPIGGTTFYMFGKNR